MTGVEEYLKAYSFSQHKSELSAALSEGALSVCVVSCVLYDFFAFDASFLPCAGRACVLAGASARRSWRLLRASILLLSAYTDPWWAPPSCALSAANTSPLMAARARPSVAMPRSLATLSLSLIHI